MLKDRSSSPYKVKIHVNGEPLVMEVDTGSRVSPTTESDLTSLLPSIKLNQTNIVLKTYTGQKIPVKGSITVNVDYSEQNHKGLKLLVVLGLDFSLLVWDWLKAIKINWKVVGHILASEGCLET